MLKSRTSRMTLHGISCRRRVIPDFLHVAVDLGRRQHVSPLVPATWRLSCIRIKLNQKFRVYVGMQEPGRVTSRECPGSCSQSKVPMHLILGKTESKRSSAQPPRLGAHVCAVGKPASRPKFSDSRLRTAETLADVRLHVYSYEKKKHIV